MAECRHMLQKRKSFSLALPEDFLSRVGRIAQPEQTLYLETVCQVLTAIPVSDHGLASLTNFRSSLVRELHVWDSDPQNPQINSPFEQMCKELAGKYLASHPYSKDATEIAEDGLDAHVTYHRNFALALVGEV